MGNSDEGEARSAMRLTPRDNVAVALRPLKAGEMLTLEGVAMTVDRNIAAGQKLAAVAIAKGDVILKYGAPIGVAVINIAPGEYLHAHNVETNYYVTQLPSKSSA